MNKLRLLNYINIKRGGKAQNIFRNIGHILLTGNSLTFKLAFDEEIRKEGDVPLATGLDFLTNRFWLIADKGMASNMKLKSLDILTKAQIIMSASVSESISQKFKKLIQDDKDGNFNLEKKKAALAGLHIHSVKPEDLDSANQETYLNFIKSKDIDAYIAKNEFEKQQAKEKIAQSDAKAAVNKKIASRAIQSYIDSENKQRIGEHKRNVDEYKARKMKWIKHQMCLKQKRAMICVVIYLFIFTLACMGVLCKLNPIMNIFFGLFTIIIPFVRPFVNHQSLFEKGRFLFSKKVWTVTLKEMINSYSKIENRPKLKLMSKEEAELKIGKID